MKYELRATEDVDITYGDVRLEAKKDEVLELNARRAEIALQTGTFELVEKLPESEDEEKEVEIEELTEAGLKRLKKGELLDKAKELGIENVTDDNNIAEIIAKILEGVKQ